MTNRQARREQSRTRGSRTGGTPARRPNRPVGAPKPTGGGGPGDFLSRPYLLGVGILVVILAVVLGVLLARSDGGSDDSLAASLETAHANFPTELANGTKVGADSAPLKLVAFEDFQCPFCLRYTGEDEPTIIQEYVKTGKVQIEFRHLPLLGRESFQAAVASQCAADQDRFWDYHNLLFLTQAKAGQSNQEVLDDGRFSDGKLKEFATQLGLDRTEFDACLDSDKHLQLVQDQQASARQRGINGTPGFLVNGAASNLGDVGNIANWRKFLDEQLANIASAAASPSVTGTVSSSATPTTPVATTAPTQAPTAAPTATP